MKSEQDRPWVVIKFGGSSVSTGDCWTTICEQARNNSAAGKRVMVVVSALSGVTDSLVRLATTAEAGDKEAVLSALRSQHLDLLEALGLKPSDRFEKHWRQLTELATESGGPQRPEQRALILAHGELLSTSIGLQALQRAGLGPVWHDARDLIEVTTGTGSEVLSAGCGNHPDPALERTLSEQGSVHITQGYIASGPNGATCLLGRGGSDTSAACLATRLSAERLEIWTDVPGIFTADPRVAPEARLLRRLSYSEAQELASMGAKILHPPSIHAARRHGIPVFIRNTKQPAGNGTRIGARKASEEAQVKGVVSRAGITLISMENPGMWRQAGFLADAFAVFKKHGYSVDLISTSEATVTVSLDPLGPAQADEARLGDFLADLQALCRVEVHRDRVSISLVGNAIRTILGRLSAALDVFQDRQVHMVTQSANDLNLTLVVDPEHAPGLVRKLHQQLISSVAGARPEFGPSWTELTRVVPAPEHPEPWWLTHSKELHRLMAGRDSAYVYDTDTARRSARRLLALESVSRVLYAVKANDHVRLLCALADEGAGFECVSMEEVGHVLASVPGVQAKDILFTPNFAPRREYEAAIEAGIQLTVDNSWVLHQWPEMFAGREIFLRLDLDSGYGHHRKVITSGAGSKFGVSLEHLEEVSRLLERSGIRVTGLHAHTGSGVHNADVWGEQLERFLDLIPIFPDVRVLDLGGGLGVPDRHGQPRFDLARLDELLLRAIADRDIRLWLEPGRYLVAECGVLLSRVTQLKIKGRYRYLGIGTGMNSLIRPALYGAFHDIVNLSRTGEPANTHYRVVGPICESGDVIGESRLLPESREGDIILIANAGAYGRVMSSHYNRRSPAEELVI